MASLPRRVALAMEGVRYQHMATSFTCSTSMKRWSPSTPSTCALPCRVAIPPWARQRWEAIDHHGEGQRHNIVDHRQSRQRRDSSVHYLAKALTRRIWCWPPTRMILLSSTKRDKWMATSTPALKGGEWCVVAACSRKKKVRLFSPLC